MATLLKNVTNCVWQAFNSLDTDDTGTVVKSKLKVSVYNVYFSKNQASLGICPGSQNNVLGLAMIFRLLYFSLGGVFNGFGHHFIWRREGQQIYSNIWFY